jgi:hypothetical protein
VQEFRRDALGNGGLHCVVDHVTKEEAERLREERLILVCREECAGCGVIFDRRHVAKGRPIGYYGQYCSGACRDQKEQELREIALEHGSVGQVVFIVEEKYCHLTTNNGTRRPDRGEVSGHYQCKLLTEERREPGDLLSLTYCFLDCEGISVVSRDPG